MLLIQNGTKVPYHGQVPPPVLKIVENYIGEPKPKENGGGRIYLYLALVVALAILGLTGYLLYTHYSDKKK